MDPILMVILTTLLAWVVERSADAALNLVMEHLRSKQLEDHEDEEQGKTNK
ncbi:MAG: hypothetical protein QNJ47_02425 [Nostocaceae cyanobacterium]|nr:hypothetical protein [Nostocaceae cyanobacterium]